MAPKGFQRVDGVLHKDGVAVASRKAPSEMKLDDSFSTGAHLNESECKKKPKVAGSKQKAASVPVEVVTVAPKKTKPATRSSVKKEQAKTSVAKKKKASRSTKRRVIEEEEEEASEVASGSGATDVEETLSTPKKEPEDDLASEEGDSKYDSSEGEEEGDEEDGDDEVQVVGGDCEVELELLDARIDRRLDTKLADGVGAHIQNECVKSVRDPIVKKVGRVTNKNLDKNVSQKIGDSVVGSIGDAIGKTIDEKPRDESINWITRDLDGLRTDLTKFANWTNSALNCVKISLDAINEGLGNSIDFRDLGSITDTSDASRKLTEL